MAASDGVREVLQTIADGDFETASDAVALARAALATPASDDAIRLLMQLREALAISIAEPDVGILREQLEQNKSALDAYAALLGEGGAG